MRLPVNGSLLHEVFWPHVFARANTDAQPPGDVALALGQMLKAGPATPDSAARWLRGAFLLETNNADTHPCLKDRLRAIGHLPDGVQRGEFPPPPPPPTQNAAEVLLGAHAEAVARQMSDEWQKAIAKQWSARHEQARKLAQELARLDQSPSAPPSAAELWDRARKLIDLKGDAEALPAVAQVLALDPRHAGANFVLGRHHLTKDDPRGVEWIETAMSADPSLTGDGCNLLYGHFARTGQRDKLRPLEHRVDEFREMAARAQRERAAISAKDSFLAAELTAEQLAALRSLFAAEPDIDSVAVARKAVQLIPQSPCFVMGLRLKVAWWKPRSSSANQMLVKRVLGHMRLPGYLLVFVVEHKLKALGKKVFAVPGAVIYRKGKE
jgi:tetratricopeptide (TPR) repeat protein